MNGRLRKASALFASVALLGASAVAMFATPASASSLSGCETGCSTAPAGGEVQFHNGPFNIGIDFSVADAGQLNTICYNPTGGDIGNDTVFLSGPVNMSHTASGGCATFNQAIPIGSYVAYYTSSSVDYQQGTENGSPLVTGDLTIPANGGVFSSAGVPTTTGFGDTVTLVFYSGPKAPDVTVTPVSTTSANATYVGDSQGGGATMVARCTQAPAYDTGTDPVTTGSNGPFLQTPLSTNGQPVICTSQETSNVGVVGAIGMSQAFLAPPAPTIGAVTANGGNSVHVAYTDNSVGATGQTFTATCNQTGHAAQTGTSSTSPITVNGLGGITPVSCTVHETFGSPNNLSGAESAAGTTLLPPPAPIVTQISPLGLTAVLVSFTGDGTPGATFIATCTSNNGGGTKTAGGTTSPIAVTGFSNVASQVITCAVTETFPAPNGLTSGTAPNTGALIGSSGPGCIPSGTVAAPTGLSTASMAFPGAVVSWSPVLTDCLVGYLVTPFQGTTAGTPTFVFGHGTTTQVTAGITEGSSYTFTVAAVTGSGVGPQSSPTGAVTIGSPAAASNVKAVKVGNGAIKVSFKAGNSNGAAIKKFTATCGSKSASGKSSPLTVRGLKAGNTYHCTVRATNSRGVGAAAKSGAVRA